MKNTLFFISLCLFAGLQAQNKIDANGKKQGPWEKKYPKSSVSQYKGQFVDDQPVGTFTYYYPAKKIQAVIIHDASSNRSSATFYHENGAVLSKGIYRSMKKDSVWLNYAPSGRLSSSETFLNDTLHGKKIIYYLPEDLNDKKLHIASSAHYLKGKMDGEKIEYFMSGIIKSKGLYLNNVKDGIWETNHPNGNIMNMERYKKGVLHGWCTVKNGAGIETGRSYFYHGTRLEGKELEFKMAQFKKLGINPNN
jgi:antitoxin component YwqK of YwqJK toxin-antitoxin module